MIALREHRPWLRRAAGCAAIALAAVAVARATGTADAIDDNARRLYYDIRGTRDGGHDVIFVAIDEDSVNLWNAPPWRWDRYAATVSAILAGEPRVIAILEPGPRLLPDEPPPPVIRDAVARGALVMAPPTPGFGQPRLALETRGAVVALDLGQPDGVDRSVVRDVIEAAGLGRDVPRRLPVNYYGAPDALPTLPAHRVASGEIPPRTFRDRIVVIGLRGERFAPQVPTPVGAMSPAEVYCHALLGLAHGAVWSRPPPWLSWMLAGVLAFVAAAVTPRLRTRTAAAVTGGAIAVIAIADYWLFRTGVALLGMTTPAVGVVAGAIAGGAVERERARDQIDAIARWLAQRLRVDTPRSAGIAVDHAPWRAYADAVDIYLDCHSTAFAELPDGSWHLRLAHAVRMAETDIVEQRRDVRRDPYKRAYAFHRPMESDRQFMRRDLGVRTFLVPLVSFERLLGIWIVNFEDHRELTDRELSVMATLADEMAVGLELRRLHGSARPFADARRQPGDSAFLDRVREARRGALALARHQQATAALLDQLPVCVLVATLWGEVETVNDAMRRFLRAAGIDDATRVPLHRLLRRLTGADDAAVHEALRQLVVDRAHLRLTGRLEPAAGPPSTYELTLSRVGRGDTPDARDAGPVSRLLLTIAESIDVAVDRVDWRWSLANDAARAIDVRAVLEETVRQLRRGDAPPRRPVIVEMPDTVPAVAGDGAALADRLVALLRETLAQGPADESARIQIDDADDAVEIRVIEPAAVLPARELAAIERGDGPRAFVEGSLGARIAELVHVVATSDGRVTVTSDMSDGTQVRIRLPKRRS